MKLKKLLVLLGTTFLIACGGGLQPIFAQHSVTLTWTAPTSMPTGSYVNIYRGTASGAESATPLNPTHLGATVTSYQDDNVLANTKYFYIAKQCDVDLATSQEVCSPPSNETSVIVPMVSGDLTAPAVLTGIAK